MSSLLAISKKALSKIGAKDINSLTESGKEADRCNTFVVDVVKEVLSQHPWQHALEWAVLPQLSTGPPFGYEYAYQLPANSLRAVDIRSDTDIEAPLIDFEVVRGKKVYTDISPCYARYVVYNESDLGQASPGFINTCAYKLAAEIAIPLSKIRLQKSMLEGYFYALDNAKLIDTVSIRERGVSQNRACNLLSAREFTDADTYQPII